MIAFRGRNVSPILLWDSCGQTAMLQKNYAGIQQELSRYLDH